MKPLVLLFVISAPAFAQPYTPPPAESVPSYFGGVMPCRIEREDRVRVVCKDASLLDGKSLRELSILRNTIYARYGWAGFRKAWLKEHFAAQPWFKPNPQFSYKLLSDADRKNAHFIATREQSFTDFELFRMKDAIYARRGKTWNDKPEWHVKGKVVRACKRPKGAEEEDDMAAENSRDCRFAAERWYTPNSAFSDALLTREDKIEIGLIDRANGSFALDEEARGKSEASLDRIIKVEELRQLSLRDLRLLRNTIYARKGRPFKSEILRDHFSGMSWYKLNEAYSDKLLSANDVRNIGLIKSVENELGGPLSDEDWLTEPAVDGA